MSFLRFAFRKARESFSRHPEAYMIAAAALVVALIVVGITLLVSDTGNSDWTAEIFHYDHGKLVVNIGNVFLAAMAVGLGLSIFLKD